MNNPRSRPFTLLALAILSAVTANAQVDREAHFENATITTRPGLTYRLLDEAGSRFHVPFGGVNKYPWFSASVHTDGIRSLGLQVGPSAIGQTENDRNEFTLVHQSNPETLRLNEGRYFGFSIYFPGTADFGAPTNEVVVSQIWQAHDTTTGPKGPVAYLAMVRDTTDLSFNLRTRNDASPNASNVPMPAGTKFVRGAWNSVVIFILPKTVDSPTLGRIRLWLNGTRVANNARHLGYAEVPGTTYNKFDIRAGVYRAPQAVKHTVFLDELRWGRSREDVDPGGALRPMRHPRPPTRQTRRESLRSIRLGNP